MASRLPQALFKQGRHEAALRAALEELDAEPGCAELLHVAGRSALALGRAADAEAWLRAAVTVSRDSPILRFHHGLALTELGMTEAAMAAFEAALALAPNFPEALHNLGNLAKERAEFDRAEEMFRRAITSRPNFAEAVGNLGQIRLLKGDYRQGWEGYEARGAVPAFGQAPRPPLPLWTGGPIAGRSILLTWEQGYGDTIQFARFAPRVAALGAKVTLLAQPALAPALTGLAGVRVTTKAPDLSGFDCWCPLLSVAHRLRFDPTIEPQEPYLAADPDKVRRWRRRLGGTERRRVALAWAGNPTHPHDAARSLTLETLAPLFEVGGIDWYSVQVGEKAAETRGWPIQDCTPHLKTFADTAALLSAVDLLVAVDTGTVHLAGALGVPAWVLIRDPPDWRWALTHPNTSPWYPSLRLFRQSVPADWSDAVGALASELAAWVG